MVWGIGNVTPFGECGLKYFAESMAFAINTVTPFGECGLKSLISLIYTIRT